MSEASASAEPDLDDVPRAADYLRAGSRTTILLGAGASVGAGIPTATRMTDAIARDITADRRAEHYGAAAALHFAIAALKAHHAATGQRPYDGLDVEELFSAIQMLAEREGLAIAAFVQAWHPAIDSFGPPRSRPDPFFARNIDSHISNLLNQLAQNAARRQAFNVQRGGLGKIIEDYVKKSGESSSFSVFDDLQTRLTVALRELLVVPAERFDYLSPIVNLHRTQQLTIATVNYDLGIESVARRRGVAVTTGVEVWPGGFDWRWPDETSLRLIKLHGSVDWLDPVDPYDLTVAKKIEVDDSPATNQTPPFVVFGQRGKVRADGPFLALLRSFEQALATSDRLLIVGYSLRDDHINTVIQRWLVGSKVRGIVAIDPQPSYLVRAWGRPRDFGTRLYRQFGQERDTAEPRMFVVQRDAESALAEILS